VEGKHAVGFGRNFDGGARGRPSAIWRQEFGGETANLERSGQGRGGREERSNSGQKKRKKKKKLGKKWDHVNIERRGGKLGR